MKTVYPSTLEGHVQPPTSKSISHRALILGVLSKPGVIIKKLLHSEDVLATKSALMLLGAEFEEGGGEIHVKGSIQHGYEIIDCKNSGTTLRLLTAIVAKFREKTILSGDSSLQTRPIGELVKVLQQIGIDAIDNNGKPPVTIQGATLAKEIECTISGNISSQYISSLLIFGATRGMETTTTIHLEGDVISRPYIDLTVQMLENCGSIISQFPSKFVIQGKDYLESFNISVPIDYSSAAPFLAAGALPGNKISIFHMNNDLPQADSRIIEFLRQMGAHIIETPNSISISHDQLHGIDANLADCPDLFPIMCVLAALANGRTTLSGAKHLKYKETNRIETSCEMLKQFGVKVQATEDGAIIDGSNIKSSGSVNSFGDHRIAIAASILSTQADKPTKIIDPDCVEVSYPRFFEDLENLQVHY